MPTRDTSDTDSRSGVRVHLHTTISERSRRLLAELTGDTGRLNDVLEDAIEYYSKRRDLPDCADCEANQTFKTQTSMIRSADMVLVSTGLLTLLAEYGMGLYSARDLTEKAKRIGVEQMKLLRGVDSIPDESWENTYESVVAHARFLQSIGVLRSIETSPDRKTLLLTTGLFQELPELFVIMLLAGWEEVGFTVDLDIVAGNKVSLQWLPTWKFDHIKSERDQRIEALWRERREQYSSRAGQRAKIALSPFLLDWLVQNTIDDSISEKTLVSIREFAGSDETPSAQQKESLASAVSKAVTTIGASGLWEWSKMTQDGEMIRVHIRCRTPPMKDLSTKLLRSLLAMDGVEEVSREEGVATAILHFTRPREVGRKYPKE